MITRFRLSIVLCLIFAAFPAGLVAAASPNSTPYWPGGAPLPANNQGGCVEFTQKVSTPSSGHVAEVLKEIEAKTGKPAVESQVVKEICFDSFTEYLNYMQQHSPQASTSGSASPTTALGSYSEAVFWDGTSYSGTWWTYYFEYPCTLQAGVITNMGSTNWDKASSMSVNQTDGCSQSRLFPLTNLSGSPTFDCFYSCATLGALDNNSRSFWVQ